MFERTNKMTDDEKAELKKEILKATPVMVQPKKEVVTLPKRSKTTMEVQKILDGLPREWKNEQGKALASLFEVLLGEPVIVTIPVPPVTNKFNIKKSMKFQAVVAHCNDNSHNYPIGEVSVVYRDGSVQGVRINGTVGNHMNDSSFRYANPDEIDSFLDKLQKHASIKDLIEYFG